jgi:xanthine/CO dehydrogenase XdhC/CoxF family maturation factor
LSKEIQQIIAKLDFPAPDEKAVLATIVEVRGSSYRLPGAKMLIMENGETFGTVSGGCLEADILERAKRVLRTGETTVFTYDTTKDENSVFSLNMGCRGVIHVLLETFSNAELYLKTLDTNRENRQKQFVATLISVNTDSNTQIGGRIFYDKSEQWRFQNLTDHLTNLQTLKNDCLNFYAADRIAETRIYQTERSEYEFFFENINPPLSLLIFGAGADAIPLAEIAENLGWQVSIADHRPAFLTKERFPKAFKLHPANSEQFLDEIFFDEQTAAVVMTHNYERDRKILARLLKSDSFYVGALGPKRRTENLLNELSAQGESFTENELRKLYAPIGLDIGAETPETIALAIAAEIQSVLKNRAGGFLRNRKGSIYGRNE